MGIFFIFRHSRSHIVHIYFGIASIFRLIGFWGELQSSRQPKVLNGFILHKKRYNHLDSNGYSALHD